MRTALMKGGVVPPGIEPGTRIFSPLLYQLSYGTIMSAILYDCSHFLIAVQR